LSSIHDALDIKILNAETLNLLGGLGHQPFGSGHAITAFANCPQGKLPQPPEASETFCLPAEIHGIIERKREPTSSI
jgi:hypothetical protein